MNKKNAAGAWGAVLLLLLLVAGVGHGKIADGGQGTAAINAGGAGAE